MSTTVRINKIVENSLVDGPGNRTVVFFQGCSLACPGCQNKALWPAEGGQLLPVSKLAKDLAKACTTGQITISGGEPFQQPLALCELVQTLKNVYGIAHITVYTGYRLEDITTIWLPAILAHIDVLVDGPFIRASDSDFVQWRGSANQRPINIPASYAAQELVFENWDDPIITISEDGNLVLAKGVAPDFAEIGNVSSHAMCGQTKGRS